MDEPESGGSLALRLAAANAEELGDLVERHLAGLSPAEAEAALRNPYATASHLEALAGARQLAASHSFRVAFVFHPAAPRALAMDWLAGFGWRDLARAAAEPRLHPLLRRAAERALLERLPGLALGEKIALARLAGPVLVAALRQESQPRVIAALLDNPRLTEEQLAPLAASDSAAPTVLAAIGSHPRWSARYPLRLALVRNPRLPAELALVLLPGLLRADLEPLARDPRLAPAVRQRAATLCSSSGSG